MSKIKLSNKIFDLHLTAQEITIYAYLCSLPSLQDTLMEETTVSVKQSTIAEKCGIKAVQTVSRVISLLSSKGLVEPIKRSVKRNGHKGTYTYKVKKLPTNDSFFFVDRSVFGKLVPRQMMIYLFISKSFSVELNDCWNSYNDIADQTCMKRETVITTIAELEELKFIRKSKRKAKTNRRVYVDNHYIVIFYVRGHIRRKREMRLHCKYSRTIGQSLAVDRLKLQIHNTTLNGICQGFSKNFFWNRGSP